MKNFFIKPDYLIADENDLWNIPLEYIPFSSITVQVSEWNEEKNKAVALYIKKDFLECGCISGTYSLIISSLFTIAFSVYYIDELKKHYFQIAVIALLLNCIISLIIKTITVIYSRFKLKYKVRMIKKGKFKFDAAESIKIIKKENCRCNKTVGNISWTNL